MVDISLSMMFHASIEPVACKNEVLSTTHSSQTRNIQSAHSSKVSRCVSLAFGRAMSSPSESKELVVLSPSSLYLFVGSHCDACSLLQPASVGSARLLPDTDGCLIKKTSANLARISLLFPRMCRQFTGELNGPQHQERSGESGCRNCLYQFLLPPFPRPLPPKPPPPP
jgi:hypothetical protein